MLVVLELPLLVYLRRSTPSQAPVEEGVVMEMVTEPQEQLPRLLAEDSLLLLTSLPAAGTAPPTKM